jgi:hypothetical protein
MWFGSTSAYEVKVITSLEKRQTSLLRQFNAETVYLLDGLTAVEYAAGIGGRLDTFRKGREAARPPVVTLEARRDGLFLGLVVSRPRNGRMVYDSVLGCWDFSVPLRHSVLNMRVPQHRRAAFWAINLAEKLLAAARIVRDIGVNPAAPMEWPRLLVPFKAGEERLDAEKAAASPDAMIDTQSRPGFSLVDAKIAVERFVADAINTDEILEDYRPVVGQFVEKAGRLQHRPRTQIVATEDLHDPPWPYSGSAIPPVNWRPTPKVQLQAV